jgi:hypothetical protein
MKIREEASAILKIRIEPNRWKQTMNRLDVQGAFTRKHERDFLVMLCEHVEKLEEALNERTTDKPILGPQSGIQS